MFFCSLSLYLYLRLLGPIHTVHRTPSPLRMLLRTFDKKSSVKAPFKTPTNNL